MTQYLPVNGANQQIPGYYNGPPVNSAEQPTTAAVEQKDGNQQPQGYYVGHPVNAGAEQPPAAAEQKDMTPYPPPPGYYNARPVKPGKPPADEPRRAEPNFFTKCFACFSSSGNA